MMIPPAELHKAFRKATKTLHHELDSLPALSHLNHPGCSVEEYKETLSALYAPHQMMESMVFQALQVQQISYHYEPRYPLLENDLKSMGCKIPDRIPPQNTLSTTDLIGCLYLLEGSKLGSQFIYKKLEKQNPQLSASFFNCCYEKPAWQAFWEFASSTVKNDTEYDLAIDAAICAFHMYIKAIKAADVTSPIKSAD